MIVSELPFYCIHVTSASDRRRHFEKQFRQIDAKRVTVVEALTPSSSEVVEHYSVGFRRDFSHWATTVACFASHLKALRTFVETSADAYAIICEDDVCFRKDFATAFQRVWDNMPEGCPLVALSYWHQRSDLTPVKWAGRDPAQKNLAPIGTTAGAVLYLISRAWADEALKRFDRPLNDIDWHLKTSEAITLASNGLLAHPLLAIERPNNVSLIVTDDPRHEAKHVAFFRRWGFENFFVDSRCILDPAQDRTQIITGFPAVILTQSEDHSIVPGRHERNLVDWSRQLAPADKQFVDCGAHTGSWSLVMAAHFREVHAFEPQRLTFQQLCGNVALNRLENVFTYNVGLDAISGRLTLHRFGPDLVRATARKDATEAFQPAGDHSSPEIVSVTALDSFSEVLTDVGLIRISVEGMELRVLKGAVKIIEKHLPKLMIEVWADPWYRQDKEDVLAFLDDLGYEVIPIRGFPNFILASPLP
jgi:FkbM family methyltransferase